jgi:hypothetical protein
MPQERVRTRYEVAPVSRVAIELGTKQGAVHGTLRLLRGEIELDSLELARSRGEIRVDLATLGMHAEDSLDRSRYTAQAQNWLDIGASRPEAERARLRWARFTLTELRELSAASVQEGRLLKTVPALEPNLLALLRDPDAGAEPMAMASGELRAVDVIAEGELTVHEFKATYSAPLRAVFEYGAGQRGHAAGVPERISIRSPTPLVVSLKVHDVKPRDSTGVFLARDVGLIGSKLASDARVWVDLALLRTQRKGQ